ncbi:BTB/POZ domain-containing protein 6-B-like isoform X2 [Microplitis mediator]|uniref:BTB/POZ domain-containing protein 6-B-like isoform X2 n=1 Tax=Microplitis mediator TaxID=375433 RepID=UPI0025546EB8|nr:BTB/POZ domain-containing protein 6-B-like isoform X2 [Microplitis mediator]
MGLPCDWQISKQKISQRGRYLLESGQWSDCKFIVGQEPQQQILEGHKLFLAMSSPVFEAMFYGSMAEKSDPIPIRDVQPEAFKTLLEYIYTDKVDLGSFELACELCYCAKKYMLPYLVEECTKYLWSDLSPNKACRAYEFAKLFEEPVLMDKCLQIICTKTNEILNEPSWDEVELSTIITIFEQDELQIDSEIELFVAIERWAKAECNRKSLNPSDAKSSRSVIGNVLSKIRFLTLTPQQFAEVPGRSNLLSRDEAFAILMNVSSSGSNIPMPEGFSTNPLHRIKPRRPSGLHSGRSQKYNGVIGRHVSPSNSSNHWQIYPSTSFSHSTLIANPDTDRTDNDSSWLSYPTNVEFNGRKELGSSTSNDNLPTVLVEGGIRDGPKYYCLRSMGQQAEYLNPGVMDCSVTFSVDKNICVIGVQVPTQVACEANQMMRSADGTYTEILYAHLLDSDGSRLTYTHFTTKATTGTLVEIGFNRPVYIQKNKIYRVGVVFNKPGWYPIGDCVQRMTCDTVFFSFGVGNSTDSVRDGLIRSIVFTYHQ